tara:strand:+ start:2332 stop:3054 length:723 start_codon:yes stop_codon:yes gene_type:complete
LESLKVLSKEAIELLENNNLLLLLVKKEIKKKELSLVTVDHKDLIDSKNDFIEANKINDDEFSDWLERNSLSEEKLLENLTHTLKEMRFLKNKFSAQCNAHFLKRKDDLDQVTYSLIRTKEYFEAKELFFRVQDDESSFGKISKEYSQGPEKYTFGLIGPVPINKAHPKVREIIRSSEIGETNQPFNLGDWWLILRVESLTEAELDKDMELQMHRELSDIWLTEKAQIIINNLKKQQNLN